MIIQRLASRKLEQQLYQIWILRLCLFWVKITSGNAFPEMRLFGWFGKFYFPEIEIRWPKKKAFDHWNRFTLLFSLQSVSGKWERERKSARALDRDLQAAISPSLIAISSPRPRSPVRDPAPSLIAISSPRPRDAVDRDLAKRIEIAIDGAISRRSRSRLREIAPDRDRDWRRDLAKIAISPSIAISRRRRDRAIDGAVVGRCSVSSLIFSCVVACVFPFICVFLLLFQTPENIFQKIFWNATKHHGNIFLFRKLAFPENMYFPENVLRQPNTTFNPFEFLPHFTSFTHHLSFFHSHLWFVARFQ